MKGFWRTVESVFAVIILMSFLLTLGGVHFTAMTETDMSIVGYEALRELDNMDDLRQHAASGDNETIISKIDIPGYSHTVMICGHSGSCVGTYPDARDVIASNYIISGNEGYEPYEIRLYLWR